MAKRRRVRKRNPKGAPQYFAIEYKVGRDPWTTEATAAGKQEANRKVSNLRSQLRREGRDPQVRARKVSAPWYRKLGFLISGGKGNLDRYSIGMAGPGIERAASLASGVPRKKRARARKGKNPADADDVVSFWREYADAQDFTRASIDAGVREIKSDPEYWAKESMSKLASQIGAWGSRGSYENPPELEPVIGQHVLALEYKGGKGKKKKSLWRHDFSRAGAKVIGLRDGSVLIKRGKRPLWRYFE